MELVLVGLLLAAHLALIIALDRPSTTLCAHLQGGGRTTKGPGLLLLRDKLLPLGVVVCVALLAFLGAA